MLTSDALIINIFLSVGLLLFIREFSAQQPWLRLTGILLMLAFTGVYAVWRYQVTLPGLSWDFKSLWPWFFFLGEISMISYEVWSWLVLRRLSNHSPRADAYERRMRREDR